MLTKPLFGDEDQVGMRGEDTVPAGAGVSALGHAGVVQLRYNYRLYPLPSQREGFARAFGCARVVVNDARRDFHHQLSTRLIRENQAVAVEDLAVRGLARTRLAKSVHDAGWAGFVAMLEYKARLYGREFHQIGRLEPTSQVCSACGVKDGPKPLHVRAWQCQGCGAWLDRDINAAVNVAKAAGLAVTACRAQVRPGPALAQRATPSREEAGTHPKSPAEAA